MFDNRVWEFLVHWAGFLSLCPCIYLRLQLQILTMCSKASTVSPHHTARHCTHCQGLQGSKLGSNTHRLRLSILSGHVELCRKSNLLGSLMMLCLTQHYSQIWSFLCLSNTAGEALGRWAGPSASNRHEEAGTAAKVRPSQCHCWKRGQGENAAGCLEDWKISWSQWGHEYVRGRQYELLIRG